MEYVDITLANYLQKHGVPEATVYYNILSDTVLGLHYMHHQTPPIIHRDLSANNVPLSLDLDTLCQHTLGSNSGWEHSSIMAEY